MCLFEMGKFPCSRFLVFCVLLLALAAPARAVRPERPPRLQSIESALQTASFSSAQVPVVVRGTVTSNRSRIVIEDRTGAVEVKPAQAERISLGDEVEVTGKLVFTPDPQVQGGTMRRLWGGSMPIPLSITPDQAADGEDALSVVQMDATLVDLAPEGMTGVRLHLRGGHQNFSAVLSSDAPDSEFPSKSIQPGATLRVTGILIVNLRLQPGSEDAFVLELRNSDDVRVVEPPSWWTKPHILLVAAVGVIIILLAMVAIDRMRHSRFRAIAEERANIARDLHDTLAQGYAGVTLQLEAAQQVIQQDPERAGNLLKVALQLVRHGRHESHISIDVLRSLSRDDRLEVLVKRCIQQMQPAADCQIEQHVSGQPIGLSYKMVNNLFRIAQEALSNAVNHARARHIVSRVEYHRNEIMIEIEDDGVGFDVASIAGPDQGHFGILGMRERCSAIGADFVLQSSSSGTLVRVRSRC